MTQPTIPEGETQNDYNYEYQTFGDRWNPIYYLDCYTTTQFKEKYPKARYRVAKTKLSEITICAINHFRMSGVISNLETHVSDFIAGAEWQKAQAGGEWIIEREKVIEVIRYMCGYTDFPARQEGQGAYYWRSILREKMEEIGLVITNAPINKEK